MLTLLLILAVATLVVLYLWCGEQLRALWVVRNLPGPSVFSCLKNLQWIADHELLYRASFRARYKYGPVMKAWVAVLPILLVFEPRDIQKILQSSKHTEKVFLYRLMQNFLGEGLITSYVAKWKTHRKLLQPSFRASILEDFLPAFHAGAMYCLQQMDDVSSNNSSEINLAPIINQTIVFTLNEAILGAQFQQQDFKFNQCEMKIQYRCTRPWLLLKPIYRWTTQAKNEEVHNKDLVDFMKKRLCERRQAYARGDFKRVCFLDHLLQIEEFTEEECIEEACTLMLAGQESVATAVAFCLHQLANNPDIQSRVFKELQCIFDNSSRPATAHDLREMQYLEQCIKETLRLYPSVPIIGRTLGEDLQTETVLLPKGSNVFIAPFATHRLPEFYPEPEQFDPDRFSTKETEGRHPYSYLPFSLGPRNCIGYRFAMLEMKTIISTILRKYHLLPVQGKEMLSLKYRVTLRSMGGISVKAVLRKSQSMEY